MHISLKAETLFHIGSMPVTNSLLTALLLSAALMLFALFLRGRIGQLRNGLYNGVEAAVEGLHGLTTSVIADRRLASRVLPLAGTIFLFVILSNWIGLLPFVGSVGFNMPKEEAAQVETTKPSLNTDAATMAEHTPAEPVAKAEETEFVPLFRAAYSDLNMTLALAIVAMVMVQVFGFLELGAAYAKKFLNFSNPIHTFVGVLEIISEVVKIFSFAFRLFGNIFAGEVLLTVIASLVPFVGPIPFLGIEAFAGSIQALIFTMLTLVFISGATTPHEHEEHDASKHSTHGAPHPAPA